LLVIISCSQNAKIRAVPLKTLTPVFSENICLISPNRKNEICDPATFDARLKISLISLIGALKSFIREFKTARRFDSSSRTENA
jgi:hypothetical protein